LNQRFLLLIRKNNKIIKASKIPKEFKKYEKIEVKMYSTDKEYLGKLFLYYDSSEIKKRIKEIKSQTLLNISKFNKDVEKSKQKIEIIKAFISLFALIILLLFISYLINKLINKPLQEFKKGLDSFFEFFKDPKKKVEKINIDTEDEFGEMAKSVNENIKVVVKMHSEMAELMKIVDKYVITSETDERGIITKASTAFCKICGYSREELIGKPHNIVRHPDMPKEAFKDMWDTIKSGKVWEGEVKNRKKNGGFYWVYAIISPKCGIGGKNCGYTAIRYDITDKKAVEDLTKNLELKVQERTQDLEEAKHQIEFMYKLTQDSIEFASMLQNAIVSKEEELKSFFKDAFALWIPKDTVGGDIWLFNKLNENEALLFVIDCTGHGVPGAFVTMIVKAIEREIITEIERNNSLYISTAEIMSKFNKIMKILLKQENRDSLSNAGFDGGIIYYNKNSNTLLFTGANIPLFYTKTGKVETIKGDRYSVGYKNCDMNYEYTEHFIKVEEGMKFFITTDGYIDQNGGKKGFPFGKKRFKKVIEENYELPMSEIKEKFIEKLSEYQGDNERNDDITVIGFEV